VGKGCVKVWPRLRKPESHRPSGVPGGVPLVDVWAMPSCCTQRTESPAVTVMLLGENDEPTILIVWVVAARAEDAMPKEARLRSAIDRTRDELLKRYTTTPFLGWKSNLGCQWFLKNLRA